MRGIGVEELREILTMGLPELARRAGLPQETVRQVLQGEIINVSPAVRDRLARVLRPEEG